MACDACAWAAMKTSTGIAIAGTPH